MIILRSRPRRRKGSLLLLIILRSRPTRRKSSLLLLIILRSRPRAARVKRRNQKLSQRVIRKVTQFRNQKFNRGAPRQDKPSRNQQTSRGAPGKGKQHKNQKLRGAALRNRRSRNRRLNQRVHKKNEIVTAPGAGTALRRMVPKRLKNRQPKRRQTTSQQRQRTTLPLTTNMPRKAPALIPAALRHPKQFLNRNGTNSSCSRGKTQWPQVGKDIRY